MSDEDFQLFLNQYVPTMVGHSRVVLRLEAKRLIKEYRQVKRTREPEGEDKTPLDQFVKQRKERLEQLKPLRHRAKQLITSLVEESEPAVKRQRTESDSDSDSD